MDIDKTLAALAEPNRRAVVDMLRIQPRLASEIASNLGMSRPAMSRHLRVLRGAGVVSTGETADDGRERVYQLEPQAFQGLRQWLDEVEAFWGDQLRAFKSHAEQSTKKSRKRS